MAAGIAVVEAIRKAGGTDTEKLIAAMEGMSFETPKGVMTFRKEDHQALQAMYQFRIKKVQKDEWDLLELVREIPAKEIPLPIRKQALMSVAPAKAGAHGVPLLARDDSPPCPRGRHPVLETRGLTIRFGGQVAVNAVSCRFEPGTLTAIVGPNGAGKTTYFNLISGQLAASAGQVLLSGEDITGDAAPVRTRKDMGRAFQLTNLFPGLTVLENVRLAVQARAGMGLNLVSMWAATGSSWSAPRTASRAFHWASGARRSPPCSRTATRESSKWRSCSRSRPDIFMFDEPTAGMSVDEVPVIPRPDIREIKERKDKTILLVEHKMDVVRSLADRIVVLHQGELVADGTPADVIASAIVQEAYLGLAAHPRDAGGGAAGA